MHEKDVYHITKSQLLANMDSMMGGRAAEELVFGPEKVTTGASSDLVVWLYFAMLGILFNNDLNIIYDYVICWVLFRFLKYIIFQKIVNFILKN